MGTIANKINKIIDTKNKIKNTINIFTPDSITTETIFNDYPKQILKEYIKSINEGSEYLYDKFSKVTNEGENIILNNTINGISMYITPKGNHSQFITTGKQLYDYIDLSQTYDFLTIDEDGWYTAICDNTEGTAGKYFNFTTKKSDNLETSTQYSIVTEIASINITGTGALNTWDRWGQFETGIATGYNTVGTYIDTPTTKSDFSNVINFLTSNIFVTAGSKITIKFRFSVIKGTNITANNFIYEPYTGGIQSPNPDYPQDIKIVTGNQNIKITNNNETLEQNYSINLGNIELYKNGYLFKNEIGKLNYDTNLDTDSWYVKNYYAKIVLNGSENWNLQNQYGDIYVYYTSINNAKAGYQTSKSDNFSNVDASFGSAFNGYGRYSDHPSNNKYFCSKETSVNNFKTWLSNNNTILLYELTNPITTKITDITLINQLNNLNDNSISYDEVTKIICESNNINNETIQANAIAFN